MSDTLKQAMAAHQSGDAAEAERLYRLLLTQEANQPDALALLGVLCATRGAHDEAVGLVEKAITLDPSSVLFKFYYGNVLLNAKRLPEAEAAFRAVITAQPAFAEAHYNLGNTLRALGNWAGAAAAYQNAIQHRADYSEAYNNLALCFVHDKEFEKAMQAARRSVELAPTYGDGLGHRV